MPVKRIVLTAGEIEEKPKPKHFPHLDPTGEQQTLTTPARSSPISTTRIYGALSMMTRHVAHLASQHVLEADLPPSTWLGPGSSSRYHKKWGTFTFEAVPQLSELHSLGLQTRASCVQLARCLPC